jgi:hypothetical protein
LDDSSSDERTLEELKKLHAELARRPGIDEKIAEAYAAYRRFKENGELRRMVEEQQELWRRMALLRRPPSPPAAKP